jgi:hypothetical protein
MTKLPRSALASAIGIFLIVLCGLWLGKKLTAQTSGVCGGKLLSGAYSYGVNGTIFTNGNLAGFYSVIGVLTANGQGAVTGTDTISQNGVVQAGRTYTGIYTVQPNCSGSLNLNYNAFTASFTIAISSNGEQVYFLQTNNGTVAAGTATRQELLRPFLAR